MKTGMLRPLIFGSALAVALAAPGLSHAQSPPAPPRAEEQTPEALLRSGIENLLRALGLALQNLPQYEMPQINEYGDIVIRRVNPTKPRPKAPQTEEPQRL
jgi:hypothetical protein